MKIGKSQIHGVGLFAIDAISKDEVVAYKGGHILEANDFNQLPDLCKAASLQIDENIYLAPVDIAEANDVMVGINHSCSPNVGISGQIDTIAMRDIEPGEELTGDYAVAYQNDYFNFKCECSTQECREVVTSDDWKNPALQKQYRGYFSMYIQKLINEA